MSEKHEFLVGYDYGMGGLWGIFLAESADEITAVYPELVVVPTRPKWMTEDRYQALRDHELHDVNGAPWGILNAVLADREK